MSTFVGLSSVIYFLLCSHYVMGTLPDLKQLQSMDRWCDRHRNDPNPPGQITRECRKSKLRSTYRKLTTGKQAIYLKKLWKAFAHEKDNPSSITLKTLTWLPHNINFQTNSAVFQRCIKRRQRNPLGTPVGTITKIELVVPHNHTSDTELIGGKPIITVDINGTILEPSAAIIIVNGTLTFDMTFLVPKNISNWCQEIIVKLNPESEIHAQIDRTFFYEFYNLDDTMRSTFTNLTREMLIVEKKNVQQVKQGRRNDGSQPRSKDGRESDVSKTREKRSASAEHGCRVGSLRVHFHHDLGMRFILYPKTLDIGRCEGVCSRSPDIHGSTNFTTGHSILLNNFKSTSYCNASAHISCVPFKMSSMPLVYLGQYDQIFQGSFPAMIINSCRCA